MIHMIYRNVFTSLTYTNLMKNSLEKYLSQLFFHSHSNSKHTENLNTAMWQSDDSCIVNNNTDSPFGFGIFTQFIL